MRQPAETSEFAAPRGEPLDGRYTVEGVLAEGGMGVVLAASHAHVARAVAIKMMRRSFASQIEMRLRFEREARLPNEIDHPGLVKTLDFGVHQGRPYFVMERLRGRTLAEEVELGGPMPPRRAVGVLRRLAEIVRAMHERGVVHRDIKPENVFLCADGEVRLLDLGIAATLDASDPFDDTQEMVGTPQVMSPEQCRGGPVDGRSDLYALAVVACYVLCGRYPFDGAPAVVVKRHLEDAPPALAGQAGALFGDFVARNLAKRPGNRMQDAGEVLRALSVIEARVGRAGAPPPAPTALVRALPPRRRRWLMGATAGLFFAAAAGGVLFAPATALALVDKARSAALPLMHELGRAGERAADWWQKLQPHSIDRVPRSAAPETPLVSSTPAAKMAAWTREGSSPTD